MTARPRLPPAVATALQSSGLPTGSGPLANLPSQEECRAATAAYANVTLAEQERLGVPENARQVLPQALAKDLVAGITGDPAKADQTLRELAADWGEDWPRVLTDLQRAGLPGETRLLAGFDDALPRQRYLLALTAQTNEPGALRSKAGADADEIDGAVPEALAAVNEAGDIILTVGLEDTSEEEVITPAVLPHGSKPAAVQGSADAMEAQPGEEIVQLNRDMRDVPREGHNSDSNFVNIAATTDQANPADKVVLSNQRVLADGETQVAQAETTQPNTSRNRRIASSVPPRKPISAQEVQRIKGTVPKAPPGVDIDANIAEALSHKGNDVWFYNQVDNGGPWDYKLQSKIPREFEDFGNFHYGATGAAVGYTEAVLLRMAGWNHQRRNGFNPAFGVAPSLIEAAMGVGGIPPFGDDPNDQHQISQGYKYYQYYRDQRLRGK